ncbi:MAG: hypothetical protein V3U76_01360 [Granulosicoccus sp.]
MPYKNLSCLIFAALIAGCSSSGNDDAGVINDPTGAGADGEVASDAGADGEVVPGAGADGEVVPGAPGVGADGEAADGETLQGSWLTPCAESSISKLVFAGDVVAGNVADFNDAECVILLENTAFEGTYVLGDSVTTSSGMQATEIDITDKVSGATTMSIVFIQDDMLYLGDADLVAEVARPDTLNFNRGFVRQ